MANERSRRRRRPTERKERARKKRRDIYSLHNRNELQRLLQTLLQPLLSFCRCRSRQSVLCECKPCSFSSSLFLCRWLLLLLFLCFDFVVVVVVVAVDVVVVVVVVVVEDAYRDECINCRRAAEVIAAGSSPRRRAVLERCKSRKTYANSSASFSVVSPVSLAVAAVAALYARLISILPSSAAHN